MIVTATSRHYGAAALAVAGLLFLLYPAVRPWHDELTQRGAVASMSSPAWVASHLFAICGFILLSLGLLALWRSLVDTAGERLTLAGLVTTWIGAGLALTYYGAEDYALNAIAKQRAAGESLDLVALAEQIRYNPAAIVVFALGLLLLAVGAVLVAIAIWRTGRQRFSGIPYALGFVLFLPQFFTPAPVRIAHGVLVAIGLVWLAATLWRSGPVADTR